MRNPFVYRETPGGNNNFTKPGDAYALSADSTIFAVADSPLRHLTTVTGTYPKDDIGGMIAQLFCDEFINQSGVIDIRSEEDICKILVNVNNAIRDKNLSLGKEYGNEERYDMGETVGVGAVIRDSKLYFGMLEDCYINVLKGDSLEDKIKIDYRIMKASKEIDRLASINELQNFIPVNLKNLFKPAYYYEPAWCNHLRNNPDARNDKNEQVGWGIFNGDPRAEKFFQMGMVELNPGDHIFLFSDGMIPILENNELLRWFIENVDSTFAFQYELRQKIMLIFENTNIADKEKTLIYARY